MLTISRSSSPTRIVAFFPSLAIASRKDVISVGHQRQSHNKARASSTTFDFDLAVMLPDNRLTDSESHASALAGLLGREKRIEDPFAIALGNSRSAILEQ